MRLGNEMSMRGAVSLRALSLALALAAVLAATAGSGAGAVTAIDDRGELLEAMPNARALSGRHL